MFKKLSFFSAVFLALSTSAHAIIIDHVYNVGYDGTAYTESYTGDLNLEQGGTVQLNFIAATNDYWNAMSAGTFWSPLSAGNNGTRIGDYSWTYLLDGAGVASGSVLASNSLYAHIINNVGAYTGMFDLLAIDYTLTSSTTGDANTLIADPSIFWSPTPFTAQYVDNASVPTPATLALFGLGLAGLGWSRRKKA